jgi:hypothetical protein
VRGDEIVKPARTRIAGKAAKRIEANFMMSCYYFWGVSKGFVNEEEVGSKRGVERYQQGPFIERPRLRKLLVESRTDRYPDFEFV